MSPVRIGFGGGTGANDPARGVGDSLEHGVERMLGEDREAGIEQPLIPTAFAAARCRENLSLPHASPRARGLLTVRTAPLLCHSGTLTSNAFIIIRLRSWHRCVRSR